MARLCAFLSILIVMSCWSTCSLGCDLPQTHNFRKALGLLVEMGRLSPVSCLKHRKDFGFPLEKMDAQQIQKAQAIPVLQNLTQDILTIFTPEDSSAPWNAPLVQSFCSDLHQQLSDLTACLMQPVGMQEAFLTQDVRQYFHRITVYLREKKHNPCAWEVVRVNVWRALYSAVQLLARLSEKE